MRFHFVLKISVVSPTMVPFHKLTYDIIFRFYTLSMYSLWGFKNNNFIITTTTVKSSHVFVWHPQSVYKGYGFVVGSNNLITSNTTARYRMMVVCNTYFVNVPRMNRKGLGSVMDSREGPRGPPLGHLFIRSCISLLFKSPLQWILRYATVCGPGPFITCKT